MGISFCLVLVINKVLYFYSFFYFWIVKRFLDDCIEDSFYFYFIGCKRRYREVGFFIVFVVLIWLAFWSLVQAFYQAMFIRCRFRFFFRVFFFLRGEVGRKGVSFFSVFVTCFFQIEAFIVSFLRLGRGDFFCFCDIFDSI